MNTSQCWDQECWALYLTSSCPQVCFQTNEVSCRFCSSSELYLPVTAPSRQLEVFMAQQCLWAEVGAGAISVPVQTGHFSVPGASPAVGNGLTCCLCCSNCKWDWMCQQVQPSTALKVVSIMSVLGVWVLKHLPTLSLNPLRKDWVLTQLFADFHACLVVPNPHMSFLLS